MRKQTVWTLSVLAWSALGLLVSGAYRATPPLPPLPHVADLPANLLTPGGSGARWGTNTPTARLPTDAEARGHGRTDAERVAVLWTRPADGEEHVSPQQPIIVAFSQPMDTSSTEPAFTLRPSGGEQVRGEFSWNEDRTVMTFVPLGPPAPPLHLETRYVAHIGGAARAAEGDLTLGEAYTWTFTTVPYPRVLDTLPADGETGVGPDTPLEVRLSAPISVATALPHISINPQPACVYTHWMELDYWSNPADRLLLLWDLRPATTYEVSIGAGITDPYGNATGEEYTTRFSTRPLISPSYAHECAREWLKRNREEIASYSLLGGVVGMAAMLLVLLILPPRQRPVRVPLRHIAAAVMVVILGIVVPMASAQVMAWYRSPARRCAVVQGREQATGGEMVYYDFASGLLSSEAGIETPQTSYVGVGQMALGIDVRPVLRMHPPATIWYTIPVPPEARLLFSVALDPEVWHPDRGDGVLFSVHVVADGVDETVFSREVDPKNRPEDRRWQDVEIDMTPYAGRTVTILFATHPLETNDWDWAGWGTPVLVAPPQTGP